MSDTNQVSIWAELVPPVGMILATLAVGLAAGLAAKILVPPHDEIPIPKLDVEAYCKLATSPELCIKAQQIYYPSKSVWSSIPMEVRKCCVQSNPNDYWDLGVCIAFFATSVITQWATRRVVAGHREEGLRGTGLLGFGLN
jgi:hypothetical protein